MKSFVTCNPLQTMVRLGDKWHARERRHMPIGLW